MKYLILLYSMGISLTIFAQNTIYKYRLYCNTEGQNVYTWSQTQPNKCPNNSAHVINSNSLSVIDELSTNEMVIKEENVPTGGNFKIESSKIEVSAGPNVVQEMIESWPYDISVLSIHFKTKPEHEGDFVTIEAPSHKVFGVITQNVSVNQTTIPVSRTVIDNIGKGFYVELGDGVNTDDLGRVISIDLNNLTITTEIATTHEFSSSTPTVVKVTIRPVDNLEIGSFMHYEIGGSKIGGAHVPANEPVKLYYKNMGSDPKFLVFSYEYLY